MIKDKKILMIWTANNKEQLGGVGHYRIDSPGKKLQKLGYQVDIVAGYELSKNFWTNKEEDEVVNVYSNMLSKYDLIWMKHTDNESSLAALFGLKKKFNCKIVWDFDDDLFNIRPSQSAYKVYPPGSRGRALLGAAMTYCDAITVSTETLKESLSKTLKEIFNVDIPIYVCSNFINVEKWTKIKYRPSNSPTIGYYGSTTHNDDLELIKPTLYKILEKYPTVRLEFVGAMSMKDTVDFFKDIPDDELLKRVKLSGGTSGWDGFPEMLINKNWDIALAPLINDKFNECKSNIKWMETAMKQIPCVCSDIVTYNTSIGKNDGILAKDKEWFNKLSKLIENPDYRVFIGKNARKSVEDNFSAEAIIPQWEKALKSILK